MIHARASDTNNFINELLVFRIILPSSFIPKPALEDEAPVGSAGLGAALAALATAKRWHQASAALEIFGASEGCADVRGGFRIYFSKCC